MSDMKQYKKILLGESYQPKEESEKETELNSILEAIEELKGAQESLDEWIDEFEELDEGARKEKTKYMASGGIAGKYGAIERYKKSRSQGHSRKKSTLHAVTQDPASAGKAFHKDRSGELNRKAAAMKPKKGRGKGDENEKLAHEKAKIKAKAAKHKAKGTKPTSKLFKWYDKKMGLKKGER